jgi:methionyl-tRNA formyltransferase
MKDIRTVFMGTSEFAVPVLRALYDNAYTICLVISQPDRPRGRRLKTRPTPVKLLAEHLNLPLFQPRKLCRSVCIEKLIDLHPDIIVTASYGQILSKRLLTIPRWGVLNVHASLLPRYRGPAPVQTAIIEGETSTGVTIMLTELSVDSGPVVAQQTVPIHPDDTAGTLEKKLAETGSELLVDTLPLYISGVVVPVEQDHSAATYTRRLSSRDGWIDWRRSAEQVSNHIRGMNPCPGAYTSCRDIRLKILCAYPVSGCNGSGTPGMIVDVLKGKGILVQTGDGLLMCEDLQPACRKQMKGDTLIHGRYAAVGDILGSGQIPGEPRCFDLDQSLNL